MDFLVFLSCSGYSNTMPDDQRAITFDFLSILFLQQSAFKAVVDLRPITSLEISGEKSHVNSHSQAPRQQPGFSFSASRLLWSG